MAIYHLHIKPVKHGDGRTAVAAAAYRAGQKLQLKQVDKKTGKERTHTFDYRRRRGVVHTEIVLPAGVKADWAMDREKLWNEAEKRDSRKNSRTAREVEVSLPHELNEEQRLNLTRALAVHLADTYKVAVDFAIHEPISGTAKKKPDEETDGHPPNHHAHLLMTTRLVEEDGLGEKSVFERAEGWLKKNGYPSGNQQYQILRESWADMANVHLADAGYDVRIDHRSHEDRGSNVRPTHHVGVHATAIERKVRAERKRLYEEEQAKSDHDAGYQHESKIWEQGIKVDRKRLYEEEKECNAETIYADPMEIIKLITDELSVFSHADVARYVHRAVQNKHFQEVYERVMRSSELVELCPGTVDANGRHTTRYSTRELIDIENSIAVNADKLAQQRHKVSRWKVYRATAAENKKLKATVGSKLSAEQREAIKHVTGKPKISAVVGFAGAGKSTMLAAARAAWEARGYNVYGTAMSGKAVDGLQQSSGIKSRTLASLQLSWQKGYDLLQKNDVLVVDESGMLDSRQLAAVISEVEKRGAKLVLVGDPQQLQPIGPGAAFRAIVDRIGCVNLTEIRRQKLEWQRAASKNLAEGQPDEALRSYDQHDRIKICQTHIQTIKELTKDYLAEWHSRDDQTMLALAHRRKDVRMLNASIRTALKISGDLGNGVMIRTNSGIKAFAVGDRIMLQENNRQLGVKNGMLGTVRQVDLNCMRIILDDGKREVQIKMKEYRAIDYGYAATVHKAQGATVDRSFVLAGKTMDHHLSYVAMTRHRFDARIYAERKDFWNINEMSKAFGRDRSKGTTLDYRDGFNERRGLNDPEIESELGPFPDMNWTGKRSKRTAALDYFAHAMEECSWMEYHGVESSKIPYGKLERAYEMLNDAKPGLAGMIKICMYNDRLLKTKMMELSGQERVEALETAIEWEFERPEQAKSDHDAGFQHDFRSGPRRKPDPDQTNHTYRPGF